MPWETPALCDFPRDSVTEHSWNTKAVRKASFLHIMLQKSFASGLSCQFIIAQYIVISRYIWIGPVSVYPKEGSCLGPLAADPSPTTPLLLVQTHGPNCIEVLRKVMWVVHSGGTLVVIAESPGNWPWIIGRVCKLKEKQVGEGMQV